MRVMPLRTRARGGRGRVGVGSNTITLNTLPSEACAAKDWLPVGRGVAGEARLGSSRLAPGLCDWLFSAVASAHAAASEARTSSSKSRVMRSLRTEERAPRTRPTCVRRRRRARGQALKGRGGAETLRKDIARRVLAPKPPNAGCWGPSGSFAANRPAPRPTIYS
jgi:hypothetical protein